MQQIQQQTVLLTPDELGARKLVQSASSRMIG